MPIRPHAPSPSPVVLTPCDPMRPHANPMRPHDASGFPAGAPGFWQSLAASGFAAAPQQGQAASGSRQAGGQCGGQQPPGFLVPCSSLYHCHGRWASAWLLLLPAAGETSYGFVAADRWSLVVPCPRAALRGYHMLYMYEIYARVLDHGPAPPSAGIRPTSLQPLAPRPAWHHRSLTPVLAFGKQKTGAYVSPAARTPSRWS
jgi:hypothetical protein